MNIQNIDAIITFLTVYQGQGKLGDRRTFALQSHHSSIVV